MKPAKCSQVTRVKTCVIFPTLHSREFTSKIILKTCVRLKDKFKMFGSISKDSPNVESSVPLYYIARKKIARSNKMYVNCFSSVSKAAARRYSLKKVAFKTSQNYSKKTVPVSF